TVASETGAHPHFGARDRVPASLRAIPTPSATILWAEHEIGIALAQERPPTCQHKPLSHLPGNRITRHRRARRGGVVLKTLYHLLEHPGLLGECDSVLVGQRWRILVDAVIIPDNAVGTTGVLSTRMFWRGHRIGSPA